MAHISPLRSPVHFYPRSPCGERPCTGPASGQYNQISIHALLAESDQATANITQGKNKISIHALLAESDNYPTKAWTQKAQISIHALLAESDTFCQTSAGVLAEFLSTLSLRRATIKVGNALCDLVFLSTLSLRRATYGIEKLICEMMNFYPRSPCGERLHPATYPQVFTHFYPRSPCGERRYYIKAIATVTDISIHALLAESDQFKFFHGWIPP